MSPEASHAIALVSPCHVACQLCTGTTPGTLDLWTLDLSHSSLGQIAVSVGIRPREFSYFLRHHNAQNAARWRLICSRPSIWATIPPLEISSLTDLASCPLESLESQDVFVPIDPSTCCLSSKLVPLKPRCLHCHLLHHLAGRRDIVGTRRCDADSAPKYVCRFELRCRHLPVLQWLALLCPRCPKKAHRRRSTKTTSAFDGPTAHSLAQAEQLGVNRQQQTTGQESELGGVSLSAQFYGGLPADALPGGAAVSCCHAMSRA
mmetsp:Transcript_18152/g.40308  ORF Transcript_18152/g.40308 Transcript_18152/m.40308 type:complete len:262 (+) Transcript_18152:78-863(+)